MQKKVIALAVAALASSAAFAQTNVTVYGVVDMGQAFVKSSGDAAGNNQGTVGRLDSNSSHIGFKGVEDLGNGLKAIFQYESGFDASSAGNLAGGRDTFIGLTGGFGTVVAGNLTHPLRAMGAKVELMPGASGVGTTMSVTGTIAGIKTGADERAQNAIAYVSPSFSGFSGTVAYVNGETKVNDGGDVATYTMKSTTGAVSQTFTTKEGTNAKQFQVAGQYDNGPLWVAAGYHKTYDLGLSGKIDGTTVGLQEDKQNARVYRVAAAYTFPTNTKLTALYDNTKVNLGDVGSAALDTNYVKRQAFSLGVAQSFGKNTVGLEYGRSGKIKGDSGSIDKSSSNIWTAMYGYSLSKRTSVHARYSRLTNGENANTNFYINPVANGVTTGYGADYTGYMVGLRHAF